MYCYREFKLGYFKNLKLFSIRVNKNIWAYSFAGKKGDGFLIFSKSFSWDTRFWVTLGDLTVKNTNLGGNLFLTENQLSRITIICVTYVQKDF